MRFEIFSLVDQSKYIIFDKKFETANKFHQNPPSNLYNYNRVTQNRTMKYYTEVCANSVESCLAAQLGGADRVELCAGIPEGGTTPSYGEIKTARRLLNQTRLHVIIRPRGGDFLYSDLETERMIEDIKMCKSLGVDGVVFGCLTRQGDIDIPRNTILAKHAEGMATTFHRAFDRCRLPFEALRCITDLKFDRILTSGQQPTAEAGIPMLKALNQEANGQIIIMAGCGINETNIRHIATETHINEFHFSAREKVASLMEHVDTAVCMGSPGQDETTIERTTAQRVGNIIAALTSTQL